jgi:hypothetical protein
MYYGALITVPKLLEFVYDIKAFRASRRPVGEPLRAHVDLSAPAANTQGATLWKDKV